MNKKELNQNINEDFNKLELSKLNKILKKISLGGGVEKIQKLHKKGKMTARERINYLLDDDSKFVEIGQLSAFEMYKEQGGCPSSGVVVVLGFIKSKLCIVVANDATVKAGAWFPTSAKKNLRAQEIAMENHIPIIYLVDSAGIFLPMQDEIFADKEHFGRIFRNNAKMNQMKIPQISAVMGSCVAGGAYLPAMSDESLIVEGTGSMFLAGSYLVKAAIGEHIDNETLGGAVTHCEVSGVADYKCKDDKDALERIKNIVDKISITNKNIYNKIDSKQPKTNPNNLLKILPKSRQMPYDVIEIVECLVDESKFEEYKKDYGKTIVCGYARIDGWSVGIVANQRKIVKNSNGEMQLGGVIYTDSAEKTTDFIECCNIKKIPLLFLHDVTGFMVGSKSEHSGIIKYGAKMVKAVSNASVPKFTVVIGNSYGAGNYAMCGKAFDPSLIVSWHSGKIGVMGGEQAAKVLSGMSKKSSDSKKIEKEIIEKYNRETSPYYAASRLWVDAIISPLETRKWISLGIEMSV